MGTTLTAMQSGSLAYKWVVAIEGYPYLISNSDGTAIDAWDGSEHTGELDGLFVELHNEQRADPRQPFTRGGRCTLRIVKTTSDDTFGIDTHRTSAGAETELRATLDRDDTTATVADTSDFPSSGEICIGTETIGYSGKTATTFTGLTRGKYAPFPVSGGTRFAQDHRTGALDPAQQSASAPLVTAQPRIWPGRLVGVWMHRTVGGVLDTKSEAQLVYAGRIVSIADDQSTGATVVELKPIQDVFQESTVGRVPWSAKVQDGVVLLAGQTFSVSDTNNLNGTALRTTNALTVVTSGASGVNQINAGRYTHELLCDKIYPWLQSELSANRLYGTYQLRTPEELQGLGWRCKFAWRIAAAGTTHVAWFFTMPAQVALFFGFTEGAPFDQFGQQGQFTIKGDGPDDTTAEYIGDHPPLKLVLHKHIAGPFGANFEIVEERGVFWNNYPFLPETLKTQSDLGDGWGVFLFNEQSIMLAEKSGTDILRAIPLPQAGVVQQAEVYEKITLPFDAGEPNATPIRQLYYLAASAADFLKYIAYSTGTAGYNHATWDALPYGLGLGIPHALLDTPFINSCDALPLGAAPIVVVIDKAKKVLDLVAGDLALRRAFTRWKDGHLELATWKTPATGISVAALVEANKAAPTGQKENHRTASQITGFGKTPIIKINYNRSIVESGRGDAGYASVVTIEDPGSIDDSGGEADVWTINAPNVYSEYAASGAGVESLLPLFLPSVPLVSRDQRSVTRSIDLRYFEGLSIGDVITLTDLFVRDPETGTRGISQVPAFVLRHRYSMGGLTQPNLDKPNQMGGEVDLMLLRSNRIAAYGPTAVVDDTANTGGFTSGYNSTGNGTLRCYAHKHSESSESADAASFAANDAIMIVEIDPANPGSPTLWLRTISSVSGNDIALTSALSSPAFDSSKKYRVVFDAYTSCTASQQVKAFQAEQADGTVQGQRAPYQYAYLGGDTGTYTVNSASDPVELPSTVFADDGRSRAVGVDAALNRLVNNLEDYKTAISSPRLAINEMSGSGATGSEFQLVSVRPIFLTQEQLHSAARRTLTVAPFMKSSDGTSATVRVTLARSFPEDTTNIDVDRGSIYGETSFTVTSSTYATASSSTINIGRIKDGDGLAWLLIECSEKARTYGLATCQEGARS